MISLHGSGTVENTSPPTLGEMLWPLEWLPLTVTVAIGALYIYGVVKLRRRGDAWPLGRTVSFVLGGLGSIVLVTQGPLAYLDTVLLWTHMVQHMILTMIAPVFMALGAPVTLALRVARGRLRSIILAVLHSRYVKVITFPLVAGAIYILNPWLLYFSDFYELTLTNSWVHNFNHMHFLIVGSIWVWALIGIDPMPRMGFPLRLLAVFITLPFHAFLGVTMMGQETLIAEDFYLSQNRLWGPSLAADQEMAGGLLWVAGDVVGLLLIVVLLIQWAGASEREAKRVDRDLDRQEAQAAAVSQSLDTTATDRV